MLSHSGSNYTHCIAVCPNVESCQLVDFGCEVCARICGNQL